MPIIKGEIRTLTDNGGNTVRYIAGLEVGDELIARASESCKGDIGESRMTFYYEAFEIGKTYKVAHMYNWDGSRVGYVRDEDGTSHFATEKMFKLKTK